MQSGHFFGSLSFSLLTCLLLLLTANPASAQKKLRIVGPHWGIPRVIDVENKTELKYRRKGALFFTKAMLSDMRDSALLFSNGDMVKLADLRALKIKSKAHLPAEFQKFFFYAGFGLIPLSVVNNLILGHDELVQTPLIYVAASSAAVGGLILFLRTKRIHTGRMKTMRILDLDFEHLGGQDRSGAFPQQEH